MFKMTQNTKRGTESLPVHDASVFFFGLAQNTLLLITTNFWL